MEKRIYEHIEITDLKDMLQKTKNLYADKIAYKIKKENGSYETFTHTKARDMIDALGTALIDMGLKGKRIAVIGENRYEWEIAYLSIVCGTGIVVPLDKALPENELKSLIERSKVEAIFYSSPYEEILENLRYRGVGNLKHLISMDLEEHKNGIYSQKELIKTGEKLIKQGDVSFIQATIKPEEMSIMLFTSGTTSASKVVALSHKNICTNLMDLASILDVNSDDIFLSVLPIHHVFECTVGFLFSLYKGAQTVFCDGIRHIPENLKEYKASIMACVPGVYERIFKMIRKGIEKDGNLEDVLQKEEQYKNATLEEKKKVFKDIHDLLGGNVKLFISGAAALDRTVEEKYRSLGFNLVQGYGLTETSPVIGVGTNKYYRLGSIGKSVPSVEAKIVDADDSGMGELVVKGDSIMLGYFENEEATAETMRDGWLYTGDLAKIDDDGYIFICGRKKSVIVLKNGKNIFPEEMENLVNRIEGVKESFVFGIPISEDKDDIRIKVKIVYDRDIIKEVYKIDDTEEEIYRVLLEKVKEINKTMPAYKSIKGIVITEKPLIKTTTNKIKRQANMDEIEC